MLRRFLNFLLPSQCLVCEEAILDPQSLCGECFQKLAFVVDPRCQHCGYPMEEGTPFITCAPCLAKPPKYKKARASLIYDDASRDLILKLKHCDRPDMAIPLARLMYQTSQDWLHEVEAIIPVPLHRWRLWQRRYNQATALAKALQKLAAKTKRGAPVVMTNNLIRIRATESQGGKTAASRYENLRAAFKVRDPGALQGKSVLLIDDVYTTGATLKGCTRALKRAGAKEVHVLTATRVVRGQDLSL